MHAHMTLERIETVNRNVLFGSRQTIVRSQDRKLCFEKNIETIFAHKDFCDIYYSGLIFIT